MEFLYDIMLDNGFKYKARGEESLALQTGDWCVIRKDFFLDYGQIVASTRIQYATQNFYNAHGKGFNMQMLDGHVEYSQNAYPHKTSLETISPSTGWPGKAYPATYLTQAKAVSLGFKPFWGDED